MAGYHEIADDKRRTHETEESNDNPKKKQKDIKFAEIIMTLKGDRNNIT